MEGTLKIIESFKIQHLGFVSLIQHFENGIKPDTVVLDRETGEAWCVKKRMLSGILLVENKEVYFKCETEYNHMSMRFSTEEERQNAIDKECEKRKNGMYWYQLKGVNTKEKPKVDSILFIQ